MPLRRAPLPENPDGAGLENPPLAEEISRLLLGLSPGQDRPEVVRRRPSRCRPSELASNRQREELEKASPQAARAPALGIDGARLGEVVFEHLLEAFRDLPIIGDQADLVVEGQ